MDDRRPRYLTDGRSTDQAASSATAMVPAAIAQVAHPTANRPTAARIPAAPPPPAVHRSADLAAATRSSCRRQRRQLHAAGDRNETNCVSMCATAFRQYRFLRSRN